MIIKFSIIVVSLNTKLDLIKTLNSIFKQKYKKYEIIVIDGLSSDGSIEYIRKLKNKNICKIIERDKGIYDAMNKGIKKAKNKWTIFLNSGDTFYNSFTLLNVKKLIEKKPNSDLIVGKNVLADEIKSMTKFKEMDENTTRSVFSHQSIYFKTQLLKKRNFDIKFKIAADFDLLKYFYKKKFVFSYFDNILSISKPRGISDEMRFIAHKEFYLICKKYNKDKLLTLKYCFTLIYISFTKTIKIFFPNIKEILLIKFKRVNF